MMDRRLLGRSAVALLLCAALLCGGCGRQSAPGSGASDVSGAGAPDTSAAEEMRGVWVSYLELDPLLSAAADAAAAERAIAGVFDTCREAGMNTVFFHVRAHGDAYYRSAVFPAAKAAERLMGSGFDPLACAVREARRRGIRLFAWINPYRIGETGAAVTEIDGEAPRTVTIDGARYYDPADAAARRLVLAGVRELLSGYAVDGIHFDDYFYPAGMPDGDVPDGMDAGDWRRTQVDALVSAVYGLAHQYGRTFGISPIGLAEKCRTTAYADVARWMREPGYIDHICPQLYFGFQNSAHPYPEVLDEWLALPRRAGVELYIGLALYKAGAADDRYAGDGRREWCTNSDILARQAVLARQSGACGGFVLFRFAHLTQPAAADELAALQKVLNGQ